MVEPQVDPQLGITLLTPKLEDSRSAPLEVCSFVLTRKNIIDRMMDLVLTKTVCIISFTGKKYFGFLKFIDCGFVD